MSWIFRARGRAQLNATPPEASSEYSKGPRASGHGSGGVPLGLMGGALLGALMLLVAEFTTLYNVHAEGLAHPVSSQGTGAHNSYGLVPIAAVAALLGLGVWRAHSRPALLALGILGVIALLIAILGDLPDAHASGLVVAPGSAVGRYLNAATKPSAGFYLETLGAAVLLITSVGGFVLVGPPPRRRSE